MITSLLGKFFLTSIGRRLPPWLWEIIAAALLVAGLAIWHHSRVVSHDNQVRAAQQQADQRVLDQTIANYRAAAAKASAEDAANAVRVKSEQTKINQESSNDYEARIAAARAAAERLRQQLASAANPGGRAGAPVPGLPATTGGSAQGAGEDGFSVDDKLAATEQAIQLDELIKWIKKQAAVDVNGNTPGQ